jgi:hypothetical protein
MDTPSGGSQAVSGKQIPTHQILWLPEGPENRRVKRPPDFGSEIFFAIFHHSVAGGLGRFVDKRVGKGAARRVAANGLAAGRKTRLVFLVPLLAVGVGTARPYSPANLFCAFGTRPCPSSK